MVGNPIRIGVALSGCGVYDGSEIHEAVLTLLAISRHKAEAVCYAPNITQHHVVNHITGEATSEQRNVLIESARIARGNISDLATFQPNDVDALIFPGGFGAAKNLSSFAFQGADCSVEPSVEAAIRAMVAAKKPVGALCIAPAVLAKVLGDVEVTIGQCADTAQAIEKMGARHKATRQTEVTIDSRHRVVTTPCYMLESSVAQIAEGADNVVRALIDLINA
ncbi:low activity glyoxalase ElbB [Azospirillaceae bacterium]